MFSQLSTRTLLILMAILGAIVWYAYFYDAGRDESTFRTVFMELDTAAVTGITLHPKAEPGSEIRFTRKDGGWVLTDGKRTVPADDQAAGSLLGQFMMLKSQSLAANSADRWDEFQVGDTTATRIRFETPQKSWDVMVGKFGYNNETRSGLSYVRMHDEKEVYTVDGFLSFAVNQPFNMWRNRNLTRGGQDGWKKLTFEYPGDSGFVMTRDTAAWRIDGQPCDSAAVATYVQGIARLNSAEFIDGYAPGANQPAYSLRIEGDNDENILVRAFPADSTVRFAVNSSINPDAWFNDARAGFSQKLFVGKSRFLIP